MWFVLGPRWVVYGKEQRCNRQQRHTHLHTRVHSSSLFFRPVVCCQRRDGPLSTLEKRVSFALPCRSKDDLHHPFQFLAFFQVRLGIGPRGCTAGPVRTSTMTGFNCSFCVS